MSEEKAKEAAPAAAAGAPSGGKPIVLIILVVVNMLVVMGVGFMLYKNSQKPTSTIDQVVEGVKHDDHADAEKVEEVGKVIPLETFIVNLAGSKGRKVLKVNMELEVKGEHSLGEIDKRKAQIRDIIIIILSSKSYDEVSTREGQDGLKTEVKDTINSFLVQGKISNVFFTEFIYN